MKPRSNAHKTECIDMTYSVITPLSNTNNLIASYFSIQSKINQ